MESKTKTINVSEGTWEKLMLEKIKIKAESIEDVIKKKFGW